VPPSLQHLGIAPADMMNIVRVNLGALGVLSRIVFKLPKDDFHVKINNTFVPITDVLDRDHPEKLKAVLEGHDYVELFWFPYNNSPLDWFKLKPAGPTHDTLWVMQMDKPYEPVSASEWLVATWNNAIGALAGAGGAIGGVM